MNKSRSPPEISYVDLNSEDCENKSIAFNVSELIRLAAR